MHELMITIFCDLHTIKIYQNSAIWW